MKKISLIILLSIIAATTFSQNSDKYIEIQKKLLKKDKKDIVKNILSLSDKEAKLFWPIYNQYMNELKPYNDIFIRTITEYNNKYNNLSNEDAQRLLNNILIVEESRLQIKKKYYNRMLKILSANKLISYFQLEDKIQIMIYNKLTIKPSLLNN